MGLTLPAAALAWVASRPGVTSVIPGARSVAQAQGNAVAGELVGEADLTVFEDAVADVYDRLLRADIHPQW